MFKLDLDETEPNSSSAEYRRAALALAEAIVPGAEGIPPADERTLDLTEQVVAHLSPWAMRLFQTSVMLLDNAAVPAAGRRFHKLDRHSQEQLLAKWQTDPVLRGPLSGVAFALKFTHFDTPRVYETMGGHLNVVQTLEEPRWLSQVVEAEEWDAAEEIECEVVVVGTGAGGAVVGKELADRGYAVVFVEEGQHHRRDAFTGSSLQAHFDFYRGALSVGNAPMPLFMGRLVGGSTAINTGSCFRTPPWILDRWCEDMDTDEFEPSRMKRHFDRVETILEVVEAERDAVGPIADVIERGCDALGWDHRLMRRNAPGCKGEGFCDFGCRTDARKSTNLSYIPRAAERGAQVFTGLRATRVRIEGGRAVGIEGVDASGRTLRVRADAVIFSGGAVPTPVFLLEQGICNSSGQVGRNLSTHPSTGFSALMPERINAQQHMPQGVYVHEHVKDGILINAAQPDRNYAPLVFPQTGQRLMEALGHLDHLATFGVMISDSKASGTVRPGAGGIPLVRYSLAPEDTALLHRGFVLIGEMAWAAGAKELFPVCVRNPHIRNRDEWRGFVEMEPKASDFMLMSYHPLGTCKMGKDPRTSVVGLDHETHDVERLFIVDGSTVPGPLGVNPQLTIMALANRAAECIADKLG